MDVERTGGQVGAKGVGFDLFSQQLRGQVLHCHMILKDLTPMFAQCLLLNTFPLLGWR